MHPLQGYLLSGVRRCVKMRSNTAWRSSSKCNVLLHFCPKTPTEKRFHLRSGELPELWTRSLVFDAARFNVNDPSDAVQRTVRTARLWTDMQDDGGGWKTINLTLTAGPLRNCTEAAKLRISVHERHGGICGVIDWNKCLSLCGICVWYASQVFCVCYRRIWWNLFRQSVLDWSLWRWVCAFCRLGDSTVGRASV